MEENEATNSEIESGTEPSFDLALLLDEDPTLPNCVDTGGLQATALGKTLDAMPIPALLVDRFWNIAFANQAWGRIGRQPWMLLGLPLSTLFFDESVITRIQQLTAEIFTTGKSQVVDARFEITGGRIRSRLYLQFARLGKSKWIVVLMEDLNYEETQPS